MSFEAQQATLWWYIQKSKIGHIEHPRLHLFTDSCAIKWMPAILLRTYFTFTSTVATTLCENFEILFQKNLVVNLKIIFY